MAHRPIVRSLLLCEQLVIEEGTRNFTLVNCFSHLYAERFPSHPFRFVIHAVLGNGLGDMNLDVVISRLADFEEVFRRLSRIHLEDRLRDYRLWVRLGSFVFPAPGVYQVSLEVDGDLLAQTPLTLVRRGS
jgi:hypothetical protein